LTNAFGECFEKPKCRHKMPEKFSNCLQKISNCFSICDDTASDVLWFRVNGEKYWENYEKVAGMQEHRRLVDNAILYGMKHPFTDDDGYEGTTTQGLIPTLSFYSTIFHCVGSITESDLMSMMTTLGRQSASKEWTIIMAPEMFMDLQNTFNRFIENGATSYGRFSPDLCQAVGMNVCSYNVGGYMLKFMQYEGFSDDCFLPQNANSVNYRKLGLILNTGTPSNIKIVHRKRRNGQVLKNWLDEYSGPTMASNHMPTSTKACKEWQWTSEVGLEMKCLNQHGLIECE
jgi:hypothetical protein